MHSHTHTFTRTHTLIHTHPLSLTQTHPLSHTHNLSHSHTLSHTHTHSHTALTHCEGLVELEHVDVVHCEAGSLQSFGGSIRGPEGRRRTREHMVTDGTGSLALTLKTGQGVTGFSRGQGSQSARCWGRRTWCWSCVLVRLTPAAAGLWGPGTRTQSL